MLEIKPISVKKEQEEIVKKCGLDYIPTAFAYKAFEGGELIASAQFDINEKGQGVFYGMAQVEGSKDDFEAMFILGRAVLNFLDLSSVKMCQYIVSDDLSKKYAKMIGFREEDGVFTACLEGMFTHACEKGLGYNQLKK